MVSYKHFINIDILIFHFGLSFPIYENKVY